MWSKSGKSGGCCVEYREALEELRAGMAETEAAAELNSSLSPEVLRHAENCEQCREAREIFWESRNLLAVSAASSAADYSTADASPWFVARVMAKIAERETEVRAASAEWSGAVTRLASRLAWVSALALLVAGTLVYDPQPARGPSTVASQTSSEAQQYLFDSAATSSNVDDALAGPVER